MKNKRSVSEERTETNTFTTIGVKYLQEVLDEMLASGELVINEVGELDVADVTWPEIKEIKPDGVRIVDEHGPIADVGIVPFEPQPDGEEGAEVSFEFNKKGRAKLEVEEKE